MCVLLGLIMVSKDADAKKAAEDASEKAEKASTPRSALEVSVQFIQPFLSVVAVCKCIMVVLAGFFGGIFTIQCVYVVMLII